MITQRVKKFDGSYVTAIDSIYNELGNKIAENLISQIKKDVLNCGKGREIYPADILSENSGSWRSEYQAVYDFYYEKYKNTQQDPWDQARKYIGKVFKSVIHHECEGEYVMYSKQKNGKPSAAYLRIE